MISYGVGVAKYITEIRAGWYLRAFLSHHIHFSSEIYPNFHSCQ